MYFHPWSRVSPRSSLCFVFFIYCGTSASLQAERHFLYYIYTGLSKPVDLPGIYEFTAMGLLDDRQIDYYNSKEKRTVPTQPWMKEKMQEDYWEKGTQSRKSKEQWFNLSLKNLMNRMRHNESDLHVLQWRVGCEVEQQGREFFKGISEFKSQWVAPVHAALPTKRKWDNVPILNQNTKGYLEKECVDWLNKFREYADEEIRIGWVRKYRKSLPEDQIESSGIRPNRDGSYQLRKSVEIEEDEKAEYDCFVSHKTIKEPIIVKWDGKCKDCNEDVTGWIVFVIGVVLGVVLALAVGSLVLYILVKKKIIARRNPL
ncbi:unnamed protein product [Leuciscus chuanchicus]